MKKLFHKSLFFIILVLITPVYAATETATKVITTATTPVTTTAANTATAARVTAGNDEESNRNRPTQPLSWTGFYVGVNGGYGWGGHPINESGSTIGGPASLANAMRQGAIPSSLAGNPSGPLGGIQVGYNYQLDPLSVLGIVADYDWANISEDQASTPNIAGFPNYTTSSQQKIKSLGTVRALIGFVPTNYPLLAYLTVGWGYGKTHLDASVSNPGCTFFCGSNAYSNTKSGWVAGAGLAYNFFCHWSVNAEYLYYDLGSQRLQVTDPGFPNYYLGQNVMYKGNVIRGGITYKF